MKHQSYIRSLFVAFCAFFVCTSALAGELNPFAFKLSSSLSGDVFTVTYYLNAPATNVEVRVDINNDGMIDANDVVYNCNDVVNTQETKLKKGIYTANISLREKINDVADFRNKTNLRWYVDVKGGNTAPWPAKGNGAVLAAKEVSTSYDFYNAGSVDVDINPYSENFGLVYVAERRKTNLSASYYTGSTVNEPGIYVFDPAFQNMPAKRGAYNFVNGVTDETAQKVYSFNAANYIPTYGFGLGNLLMCVRLAYDSDNETRLFASCQTREGPILMYGHTKYMNCERGNLPDNYKWYHYVISDVNSDLVRNDELTTRYKLEDKSGNFVAAPNITFDIYGAKNSRKVLMASSFAETGYTEGGVANKLTQYCTWRESYRCDEYDISNYGYALNTTSSPYNCKPSLTGVFDLYYRNSTYEPNTWFMDKWSPGVGSGQLRGFCVSSDILGIEYDVDGLGFWLCNTRDHNSGMPSLTHFVYNSTTQKYDVNYVEYWAGRGASAIRYDIENKRLAVSGGKPCVKESTGAQSDSKFRENSYVSGGVTYYKHPAATPNYATIYTVDGSKLKTNYVADKAKEQTEVGTTVTGRGMFTDSVYIDLNGRAAYDFAWDYADNLYVATGVSHKMLAYALPNGGKPVSTPCKDAYRFNTNASQLIVNIYPQNVNCGTVVDYEFQKSFAWYMNGAKYKLEAEPAAGYRFVSWYRTNSQHEPVFAQYHTKGDKTETVQADFGINVHEDTKIVDINSDTDFKAVYVKRDLDDVSYSTICLPFNLETLVGTPYEGASVLEFTAEEKSNVGGDNRISLNFTEVTFGAGKGMRAGKPYLIQVKNAVSGEKMFWDVTCPDIDNQGQSVININGTVTFHALLNPTTFTAAQLKDMLFLTADNRLVTLYGQNSVSINGLRGYFTVSGGMSKNAEFVLNLPDKVVTSTPFVGIEETQQPTKYMQNGQLYIQQGEQVYNMNGALVK